MTLSTDQECLEKVLELAGGDRNRLSGAIEEVLPKGPEHKARRTYLRAMLYKKARRRIKRSQKIPESFSITPGMRLDAYRHAQQLTRGIPEDDL